MKITNFILVFLGLITVSFASEREDSVPLGRSSGFPKKQMLQPEIKQQVSVEMRLLELEKQSEENKAQIEFLISENKKKTTQIELLQQTVGNMGNNRPVYQKLIPADAVFWISLGWTFLATYQVYNGNFITATTVFFTTFISIYWGIKEARNLTTIVLNRTRYP